MSIVRLITIIFALLTLAQPAFAKEAGVGIVVTVKGASTIESVAGERRQVKMGMKVYVGDRVETKRGATLKIVFLDQSEVALAGDGELVIDEYVYGENKRPKAVTRIESGFFRFMAGKMAKEAPENYKIETATATIGIRGSGGEGFTSNGRNGSRANLILATAPGHVLEVKTLSGNFYVIEEPGLGLKVDGRGIGRVFHVDEPIFPALEESSKEKSKDPLNERVPNPFENNKKLVIFPFKDTAACVFSRRRYAKPLKDRLMKEKYGELFKESLDGSHSEIRDISLERDFEVSSSRSMLQGLSKKTGNTDNKVTENKDEAKSEVKKGIIKHRDVEDLTRRERGGTSSVLSKLGREQVKAFGGQLSFVEREKSPESQS